MATIIPTEELYRQHELKEHEYNIIASIAIINDKEKNAIKELEYHLNSHQSMLSYLNDEDRETGIAVRKYLSSILYDPNNHEKPKLSDIEKKVYETAYWYLYRLTRDEEGMHLRPSFEAIKSIIHLCYSSYELVLLLKFLIKKLEISLKKKKGEGQEKESNKIKITRDKILEDLEKNIEMITKYNGVYRIEEMYGVKEVFNYINEKAKDGIYDIEPGKPVYDFMRKNIYDKKGRKIECPTYYHIEL
jgi:hypothetical protein